MIQPKLSLVMPIYNERLRLRLGLQTALSFLKTRKYDWEVILVDDGSTDDAYRLVYPLTKKWPQIHWLRSRQHAGKGYAVRQGIKKAQGKYVIFSDIDFSVPVSTISPMLSMLKKNKVVIGSRKLRQSVVLKRQSWLRQSLGQGFTCLANLILGLGYSDLTCGFKGFEAKTAKSLFALQKINGWVFDAEVLFLVKKLNISVIEMPVKWENDSLTKVRLKLDLAKSFVDLLKIKMKDISGQYD